MNWQRELAIALVAIACLVTAATASATTSSIPVTSDDPGWLAAHGLTPVATLEVADDPAKLPDRCWHARVFSGLKGPEGHPFEVWAHLTGIVCSLNGKIDHFHSRWGKGHAGTVWQDGPYPTIIDHGFKTSRHVWSSYSTDWRFGSNWQRPIWGVELRLDQYWSKRVDRAVHWHHYPSA